MALKPVPWAIGNGAENPVEGARLSLNAATKGARGVLSPSEMRVTALPVPGAAVRVNSGACVTPNDYIPGGGNQSYALFEESSTDVEVPATGSGGGATRYLIVRVKDHQYAGQAPQDVTQGPYNEYALVSSLTNISYPHVPLAKIVQPASTGTITQSMITDIREVANPRALDIWIPRPVTTGDIQGYSHVLRQKRDGNGVTRGEQFPDGAYGGKIRLSVPEWAVRAHVGISLTGVRMDGRSSWGAWYFNYQVPGEAARRWGQDFGWDANETGKVHRVDWHLNDSVYLPPSFRGKEIDLWTRAFVDTNAQTGVVSLDARSGINFRVRFIEQADTQVEV